MKNLILILVVIQIALPANTQNIPENYLYAVAENNTEIKAARQKLEAEIVGSKTKLTPDNPEIEYGYFPGNSNNIGVKEVFEINQSFKFPGIYLNRISDMRKKSLLINHKFNAYKLEILLQAKLNLYEYIYLNKKNNELKQRAANTEELLTAYQKQYENGNISIIELNKVRFQNIQAQNKLNLNSKETENMHQTLIFFNGGIPIEFKDASYLEPEIVTLDSLIVKNHSLLPQYLYLQEEAGIAENEIQLSRYEWFPEFSIGYESETILAEKYAGIKAGISVPLWKNVNEVEKSKLELSSIEISIEHAEKEIVNDATRKYEMLKVLQNSLKELESILESNHEELLSKSLNQGAITLTEYFIELSYFYEVRDSYLELEKEYFKLLAELNKVNLLSVN